MTQDEAARCFNENRISFSNPQTTPEKFNLYNGLECMAVMVQTLLSKVEYLEREIDIPRRELTPGR